MTIRYVTQSSVTESQPGVFVSYTGPGWVDFKTMEQHPGVQLHVGRYYDHLTNQFGGKGRRAPMDGDGLIFDTIEAAQQYCIDHGYVQRFYPKASGLRKQKEAL